MSKSSRRIVLRTSHQKPDPLVPDDLPEEPSKGPLADPACAAVAILIGRALGASGVTAADAGADGVVTLVLVPSAAWVEIARDGWKTLVRNDQSYQSAGRDSYWRGGDWVAWAPEGPPRPSARVDEAEWFAKSVAQGHHCAAFAAEMAWLPEDLVHAADHRLELPLLNGVDVQTLAESLCGGKAADTLSNEGASELTPKLLRLARRRDQTADAFIDKMRELLDFETEQTVVPAATSGSPRDEPTLERMHGMDEAVAWGLDVAKDLALFKDGQITWGDVDRGCLLSGPPGCGKTLFARALATTCDATLVTGSYGEWHSEGTGHQGDFLKAMMKTFELARSKAPCILFIDEVDSFPNRATLRHTHADYMVQVVNAMLTEIDGSADRDGVIIVAACNHPEKLDPALVRSGRLDRHIRIGLPDRAALAAIFREHLGADIADDDLSGAAMAVAGASGADCERLVRGARRRARTADRQMVISDLLDEIGGIEDRSLEDQWVAAIHEAGHVVAACIRRPGSVGMVSLRRTAEAGGMMASANSTSIILRRSDVLDRLMTLLAGRAAEEVFFGQPSASAGGRSGSDLAQATNFAVMVSAALGLDQIGGLVWRGMPEIDLLQATLADDPALADRVRTRLDEAYVATTELVRQHIEAVKAVAVTLLERRVLDGAEAEDIVCQHLSGNGARP